MLTVYLFCVSAAVVAANPVFQRINVPLSNCPSQACPSQACPGQVCPAQACPAQASSAQASPSQACPAHSFPATATCSNQVLPTPCQTCKTNPLQTVLSTIPVVVRPSSNNCPCTNPAPVQNHVINQPVNQDALNQLVLSKILTPQLQTLLSSSKACNQCDAQQPAQPAVPNVINNYIIIPPDYYKANESNNNSDGTANYKTADNNRKRKQNRQMAQNGDSKLIYDLLLEYLSARRNGGTVDTSELEHYIEQRRQNNIRYNRPRNEELGIYDNPYGHSEANYPYDKIDGRRRSSSGNTQIKTINTRKKNPQFVKKLEEAIVKDFCLKNPLIPQEIARSLLANVISQIQNQGHLPSRTYSPIEYGQHNTQLINTSYKESDVSPERERTQTDRRHRRPKKNRSDRRNRNQKENKQGSKECEKCNKTVELNPTILNIEKETITTEKITTTTEQNINKHLPKKVSESQIEIRKDLVDKIDEITDKFSKLNEIETTTVSYNRLLETFPELGKEDEVPTFDDNGVDEYYPDFRGDIPYYATDEGLDRYHYSTDINGATEGKRYVNSKKHKSFNDDNRRPNLSDTYSEYMLTAPVEEDSFERDTGVQFRTPPLLDLPDFRTKQINKYYNSEEVNDKFVTDDTDKASVYSDFKTDYRVNDYKPVKIFSKDKKGKTNIETVLGHSKVVKYGQDSHGAASTPAITYYLPEEAMTEDRIQLPDGEDAVVVAKSIWDLEDAWM